jgi:hypothetical protein
MFPTFLEVMREVAPGLLNSTFASIDPAEAERSWAARLQGKTVERRAVAALMEAASQAAIPAVLEDVIERLRRRFPRASRSPEPRRATLNRAGETDEG